MIESGIIKRYIIKTFMQQSRQPLKETTEKIMNYLQSKFLLNENVIYKQSENTKIAKCNKDKYLIVLSDNSEIEVDFNDLERRFVLISEDIQYFLESITKITPFGRILIENVFDKITDARFGSREKEAPKNNHSIANNERKAKPQKVLPKIQNLEDYQISSRDSNKQINMNIKPEENLLDFKKLKSFQIMEFDDETSKKIIKIYMFERNFSNYLKISEIGLESLIECLRDSDYASETAFLMHSSIIEHIQANVDSKANRFFESISFILDKLKHNEETGTKMVSKKITKFTFENWKTNTKNFIINLSFQTENENVLRFLNIFKKDNLKLRIDFLEFLVDLFTLTDRFRDFVQDSYTNLKNNKAKIEQLQTENKRLPSGSALDVENSKEIEKNRIDSANHPLKSNIGKYKDYVIFIMDKKIFLKNDNKFFILNKENAFKILRDLNSRRKSERITSSNLKEAIDIFLKNN